MGVYKNGNTIVEIKNDGTKIRYIPDNQIANPQYPESIDLKITNKCFMNCSMCHEKSTSDGVHGNLNHPLFDSLHPFTELAIGGGDPMTHPELEAFLRRMKDKQIICNLTVHCNQFENNYKTLKYWEQEGLIHGLGVSVNQIIPSILIERMIGFPNLVVHTIIGVADKYVYDILSDKGLNILMLGYKTFGRGVDYLDQHSRRIAENIESLAAQIERAPEHFRAVSFDNLAINQLKLKEKMTPKAWETFYMGDDGMFTMYVDIVNEQYAISSTSKERNNIDSNNIDIIFSKIKNFQSKGAVL